MMVHLQIGTNMTPPQNCYHHPLVNGLSHLRAIAVTPPRHVTETWAVAIEALVLTALPHRKNLNTAGQAVAHHVVLWLPPRLLITPLMAVVAGHLVMAVVDTVLARHIQVAKVKVAVVVAAVAEITAPAATQVAAAP